MKDKNVLSELFFNSIDSVIDEFKKNQNIIFKTSNERLQLFYPPLLKEITDWKKKRKCIYRGCNELSIKKSHVIPLNTFFKLIQESGHVCSPMTDIATGKTVVRKVGVNDASTFPGFCEKHEKMFNDFEQRKIIENADEIYRQMYRTVCREVVIKEHKLALFETILEKYLNYRNARLLEKVCETPSIKFLHQNTQNKIKGVNFKGGDHLQSFLNEEIKKLKDDIKYLNNNFLNRMHDEIEKNINSVFEIFSLNIEQHIPVALAGRGSFKIKDKESNNITRVYFFMNVLPSVESTSIYVIYPKKHKKYIKEYLFIFLEKDFGFISLIETWMIHCSDHWFLKPSVWEVITKDKQKILLDDLMNLDKKEELKYNKTIFNKIKRDAIKSFKKTETVEFYKKIWNEERLKFTDSENNL